MTQEQAIELAMQGHNIFLTGQAGTGKSYTANKIITALKERGKVVAKTASTGIASTHINGTTIHSWAGIGIKDKLIEDDLYKLKNNRFSNKKISNADVLIIDEISMLHDYRFDMIEQVCSFVRDRTKLFGGLQIICVGDFMQLPPVNRNGSNNNYCFNARAWQAADFKICYLTKIYRQEKDSVFIELLNAIRHQSVGPEHVRQLRALSGNMKNIKAGINLYCKNVNVNVENTVQLNKLPGESYISRMISSGIDFKVKTLKNNLVADETLILKEGAKVMLLVNKPGSYVNGTLCIVKDLREFESDHICEVENLRTGARYFIEPYVWKAEENDEVVATCIQFPIKLAYASTIHKAQGCTFDFTNIDMSDTFVENMGYVALSRCTTMDGIFLKGFNELSLKIDPVIIAKDQEFQDISRRIEG
jgi:ATP-dependent exoDNAse (exonuclease V) alpha subunit